MRIMDVEGMVEKKKGRFFVFYTGDKSFCFEMIMYMDTDI